MPLYKRCSCCGKRIEVGSKCECVRKRYKKYRESRTDKKENSFYMSEEWRTKREKICDLVKGVDLYSYYELGRIELGRTLHHIVELKEDWSKRLDDDNLILLTDSNHRKIHNIMLKSEDDKCKIQNRLREIVGKFYEEIRNNER